LGFGVWGSGFGVWGLEFSVCPAGVWGLIKNNSKISNHYSLFLNLRGISPFRYRYSRNDAKCKSGFCVEVKNE